MDLIIRHIAKTRPLKSKIPIVYKTNFQAWNNELHMLMSKLQLHSLPYKTISQNIIGFSVTDDNKIQT